jgi:hypothetical protein
LKYHKLTHEQFEELHQEFAIFLATQGLDYSNWAKIKESEPKYVDDLLDLFSDLVWDKIISECKFLEHISRDQLFLFKNDDDKASAIVVKISDKEIDLASSEGFDWILKHFDSDNVTIHMGSKIYDSSKNDFVYSYLKKGAIQTNGYRFKVLETYFSDSVK